MTVLLYADVAAIVGLPRRTIYTYVHRRKHELATGESIGYHANIPLPDTKLADRPAWNEETIRPWLDERKER
jgi:predicted DNA-binding transcriptional regulator AlpA